MKCAQVLVLAMLAGAGGMAGVPSQAQVQGPVNQPVEANTTQPPGQEDVLIQRIRGAQDPSTAIQAYAEARAVAPNDLAPLKAYVHRMAELGLPEMADLQAQDLLKKAPEDGTAWAVAGYLAAKRDQMEAAATDLAAAVRLNPDDPFVQRTAGQIVAWADTRPDKSVVTAPTRTAIDTLRAKLQGKAEYSRAYLDATAAYQRLAASSNTTAPPNQPSQPQAQPAASPVTPTTVPTTPATIGPADDNALAPTYVPGSGAGNYPITVYPSYAYTYDYGNYYSSGYVEPYPYWYPPRWYGSTWWWPTASSYIIVDNECRDHFKHDHDNHYKDLDEWRLNRQLDHARGWDRSGSLWDRRYFGSDRWPGDRFLGNDPVRFSPMSHGRPAPPRPERRGDAIHNGSGEFRSIPAPGSDRANLTSGPPVWRVPGNPNGMVNPGRHAQPAGATIAPPQRIAPPVRMEAPHRTQAAPAPRAVAPSSPPRIAAPAPRVAAPAPRSAAPAPRAAAPAPRMAAPSAPRGGRSFAAPSAPARVAAPSRPSGGISARQFSPTQGRAR